MRTFISENKVEIERCKAKKFKPITENEKIFNVISYAKKISNKYYKDYEMGYGTKYKEDFDSAMMFGIVKAIKSYDESKNILFLTYASKCVENEIKMLCKKINMQNKAASKVSLEEVMVEKEFPIYLKDMIEDTNAIVDTELLYIEEHNDKEAKLNKVLKSLYYTKNIKNQRIFIYQLMGVSQDNTAKILGIAQATVSRLIREKIKKLYKIKFLEKPQGIEFEMYLNKENVELYISDRLLESMEEKLKNAKYIGKVEGLNKYQIKKTKRAYELSQEFLIKLEKS